MTQHSNFPRSARRLALWLTALFTLFVVAPALLAQEDAPPISLDLRDGDLPTAIHMLMQASGANIVLSGQVSGRVSCTLTDKTLEEILDTLAAANGFYWHKTKSGVYVISAQPPARPEAAEAVVPPPPPATGQIDLTPRTVAEADTRQQLRYERFQLRHIDPSSTVEMLVNGRDPGVERLVSTMRESGYATTGMFRNAAPVGAAGVGL